MGGVWVASLDREGPCNGDVLVKSAKGRMVAVIYSTGDEAKTLARATAFIRAAAPRWCTTCGVDTVDTTTCAKCEKWWADNQPPVDFADMSIFELANDDLMRLSPEARVVIAELLRTAKASA